MPLTIEEIIQEIERRMGVNESFIKKLDDFNMKKNAILQGNTLANLLDWIKSNDEKGNKKGK